MAKTAPTSLTKRFPDRDEVAAVRAEADALEAGAEAEETRRLAGRVLGRRGHGKLVFLDLVDRSGQIQLLCSADRAGPVELDLGDVVGAIGKAAKTRRGEPSLAVDELVLLAKIKRPLPDTYHGLVDLETRYRKRFLDLLVNEDTRRAFELRSRMVTSIRRHLDEAGFIEVETPVLQPRYGGAFADPFVTHHNELDADLYLRIATELYLKRLIVGGLEKVYEIGKDFRNEGVSYKHQPEFTMLEWYEAYADYTDTMSRIEQLVAAAAVDTVGTTEVEFRGHRVNLAPPWQRLKLADALEELGFWTPSGAARRSGGSSPDETARRRCCAAARRSEVDAVVATQLRRRRRIALEVVGVQEVEPRARLELREQRRPRPRRTSFQPMCGTGRSSRRSELKRLDAAVDPAEPRAPALVARVGEDLHADADAEHRHSPRASTSSSSASRMPESSSSSIA